MRASFLSFSFATTVALITAAAAFVFAGRGRSDLPKLPVRLRGIMGISVSAKFVLKMQSVSGATRDDKEEASHEEFDVGLCFRNYTYFLSRDIKAGSVFQFYRGDHIL